MIDIVFDVLVIMIVSLLCIVVVAIIIDVVVIIISMVVVVVKKYDFVFFCIIISSIVVSLLFHHSVCFHSTVFIVVCVFVVRFVLMDVAQVHEPWKINIHFLFLLFIKSLLVGVLRLYPFYSRTHFPFPKSLLLFDLVDLVLGAWYFVLFSLD